MIDEVLIGKIIQKYRKLQGLTQEKLAEKVNISTNYLSKIERGLNAPNVVTFLKIAQVLQFTLDDFGIDIKINSVSNKKILIDHILAQTDNKIEKYLKLLKCFDEIEIIS